MEESLRAETAPVAPVDLAPVAWRATPSEVKDQILDLEVELMALRDSSARIQHVLSSLPSAAGRQNRISMVIYSPDPDRLRECFTIATGAASTGTEVEMFFTCWATTLIKRRVRDKDVSELDELFGVAMEMGIRIHVCEKSMDLLGLQPEDLMEYPGMEVCEVSAFLSSAKDSKITLSI